MLSTPSLQCDQVMEFSWSALWNITDETPDNCEMFLNFNGMKLFLDCLKVLPISSGSSLLNLPHGHSSVPRHPTSQIYLQPLSPWFPQKGGRGRLTGPHTLRALPPRENPVPSFSAPISQTAHSLAGVHWTAL